MANSPTLLDLFRTLSSFSPKATPLGTAPWELYVDWAIHHGLAPLAAYNLEYRLGGCGAPDWAREKLLAVYQGSANDNVMKLVNFKRSVSALVGRKLVLFGAASAAEALYPHMAFRPIIDLRILVGRGEVEPLAGFLRRSQFEVAAAEHDAVGARTILSDGRTTLYLHDQFRDENALLARAVPMPAMGPSVYRLSAEDAFLGTVFEQARHGYEVPKLTYIDLRELLRGAPEMAGAYSRPLEAPSVRDRAKAWKLERALYVSLRATVRLFPEVADAAEPLLPDLRRATRELLERAAVESACRLGSETSFRGAERWRRLLAGA